MRRLLPALILTAAVLAAACSETPVEPQPKPDPDPTVGFVLIPAGTFLMGSPLSEPGRAASGEDQHQVTLTRAFWMQTTEVTSEQYRQVAQWALDEGLAVFVSIGDTIDVLRDALGAGEVLCSLDAAFSEIRWDAAGDSLVVADAGQGLDPTRPAGYLSWWGAAVYCNWLSLRFGLEPVYDHETWASDPYAATGFRLPTEAEWEYAARAGSGTAFAGSQIQVLGCDADSLALQGWYCHNAEDWPRPVGQLRANAFGLFDMHGNVWEVCNDWFGGQYYAASPDTNPAGPPSGFFRTARGGSGVLGARFCRSAQRGASIPGQTTQFQGLRPVLAAAEKHSSEPR